MPTPLQLHSRSTAYITPLRRMSAAPHNPPTQKLNLQRRQLISTFPHRQRLTAVDGSRSRPSTKAPKSDRLSIYLLPVPLILFLFLFQTPSNLRILHPPPQAALPTCSSTPATTFLIIFQSRSGSTAISSQLASHPSTHMEKLEYLHMLKIPISDTNASISATEALFSRGLAQNKTVGFKMRPWRVLKEPQRWRQLVAQYHTRIVWQYRRNVLKSAIGIYAEVEYNDTKARSGVVPELHRHVCEMGVGCTYAIRNFTLFHQIARNAWNAHHAIVRTVSLLDNGRGCMLELPYEDYLYHPDVSMRRLVAFLGLPWSDMDAGRRKATGDSLCEVVSNWEELCEKFYGCLMWRDMLTDHLNGCTCEGITPSADTRYCQVPF